MRDPSKENLVWHQYQNFDTYWNKKLPDKCSHLWKIGQTIVRRKLCSWRKVEVAKPYMNFSDVTTFFVHFICIIPLCFIIFLYTMIWLFHFIHESFCNGLLLYLFISINVFNWRLLCCALSTSLSLICYNFICIFLKSVK